MQPKDTASLSDLSGAWELTHTFDGDAPPGFDGRTVQGLFVCAQGRVSGSNALGWIWYGDLRWAGDGEIVCEILADPVYAGRAAALPGPDGELSRALHVIRHELPVVQHAEPMTASRCVRLGTVRATVTLRRLARFRCDDASPPKR